MAIGILGIAPLAYLFKKSITANPKKYWNHFGLYWFTDVSETWGTPEQNYLNNWYGVYELHDYDYEGFKKKSALEKAWWNYVWMAWRNPHWNAKRALAPIEGLIHSISFKINTVTPERETIDWVLYPERGVMFGYFWIEDQKFFRYSHIIDFTLFGKKTWLFELGTRHTGQSRYAAKSKITKYKI